MSVRLFVGNLPYDVTENEIREFFAPVGRLQRIFLPVDRETGKQRGFAFVEFGSQPEADDAIRRMNSQSFKGRPIAVKEARERENRAPGGNGSHPPRSTPLTRPAQRPIGVGGVFPASGTTEEIGSQPRRRSFGPAAKPDRKRRPQQNKPHKSEWGKRAFRRERLRDDDDDDLSLYAAGVGEYQPDTEDQELGEQELEEQEVEDQEVDGQEVNEQDSDEQTEGEETEHDQ